MATTATKSPVQLVSDAYDVLLKNGDLDGFCDYFDDDTVMSESASLPYGGEYQGREAIKQGILGVFGYWKDFSFDVKQLTEGGNYVIAYGTFSATSIKTGQKVSFPLAEVWEIVDGRVKLCQPIYSDTKMVCEALGVS